MSAAQGVYEVRPNAFGGYDVFIEFSDGDVRQQGRFSTDEQAQAWVESHKGWQMVRRIASPRLPVMSLEESAAA